MRLRPMHANGDRLATVGFQIPEDSTPLARRGHRCATRPQFFQLAFSLVTE